MTAMSLAEPKLTLRGGVNRMGRLLRGAQTNDFGAAVLPARSAGKQAWGKKTQVERESD
jgi:hypothetical protein